MTENLYAKNVRTKMENRLEYTLGIDELDEAIGANIPIGSMVCITGPANSGKTWTMIKSFIPYAITNDAVFITINKSETIMMMITAMAEENYILNMKDVKTAINSIYDFNHTGDIDKILTNPKHMVYIDEPMMMLSSKVKQQYNMYSQVIEVYRYMKTLAHKYNKIIVTPLQSNRKSYESGTDMPLGVLEGSDLCINCIERDKWTIVKNKWGPK